PGEDDSDRRQTAAVAPPRRGRLADRSETDEESDSPHGHPHRPWHNGWSPGQSRSDNGSYFALNQRCLTENSTSQRLPVRSEIAARRKVPVSVTRDSSSTCSTLPPAPLRSEERRVGKECRARPSGSHTGENA